MQYFAERHLRGCSLAEAVARGLRIQESTGLVFTWLTSTNAGAADVCRAALGICGIDDEAVGLGAPYQGAQVSQHASEILHAGEVAPDWQDVLRVLARNASR